MKVRSCLMAALVLAVLGVGTPAWAQTDEEHFQTFPFNFSAPGARPMAMGGAFIGLPADASAVATNPAGLMLMPRRQFVAEFRNVNAPVMRLNNADSMLTAYGNTYNPTVNTPSFFSFAMPIRNKKAVIGFSYQQFLNFNDNFQLAARRSTSNSLPIYPAVHTILDYKATSYLATFATKMGPVQIGASASLNRMAADQDSTRTSTGAPYNITVPNTHMHDSSMAFGLNAGLLYRVGAKLNLGATFTKAPSFTMTETADAVVNYAGKAIPAASYEVPFDIPDRLGVGVALRPGGSGGRYVFVFDAVRVFYSQLAANTQIIYYSQNYFPFANVGTLVNGVAETPTGAFKQNNANEFHGGLEVQILRGGTPVFARAGMFLMSPHILEYDASGGFAGLTSGYDPKGATQGLPANCQPGTVGCYPLSLIAQPLYAERYFYIGQDGGAKGLVNAVSLKDNDLGMTFGIGVLLKNKCQLDVAYMATNNQRRREFVVSAAIYLK